MARSFLEGVGCLLALGLSVSALATCDFKPGQQTDMNGRPVDQERFHRITACEVAIRRHLDDPDPDIPNYLSNTSTYQASRDHDGNLTERFDFRSLNRYGGYDRRTGICTFDSRGEVIRTNYDDQ